MHAIIRGEHGHAVASLWHRHVPSCSLAIGPRHPSYWQKTVKKSLQLTLHLTKYFDDLQLKFSNFTKNEMSGINWVVLKFKIDYLYWAKWNRIVLMGPQVTTLLLRSLNVAINDGLEMKLKVTKNDSLGQLHSSLLVWWWWQTICSGCPLSSVFLWFLMQGFERSPKSH